MRNNFTYLYGISKFNTNKLIKGIEGEEVKGINYSNFYVLYSDVKKSKYKAKLTQLQEHNRVLDFLIQDYVVLPFAFGTVVKNKKIIDKFVEANTDEINKLLEDYKGKVEVGLKICSKLEQETKRNKIEKGTGKSYMMKLYNDYQKRKKLIKNIKQRIKPLTDSLNKNCDKHTSEYMESPPLIFNASYLIKENKFDFFKEKINEFKATAKDDVIYKFSGPWAPYNFVNLKGGGDLLSYER
ncbi:GvpL/GvpF family gas vesicle protein [Sporohalobacter salinus]|uniref:GvpL/GvpF family gas vesicle protein n=1 Tax=Sporohalobacter salinus TaxID=1494606 RepID=UPI00195F280B|nr:GvpL/GvpF family gas vesicle protein [Sporohalobacter salinus]MBM7623259.1 hypothetical protein [Sporohalobacter salinus]